MKRELAFVMVHSGRPPLDVTSLAGRALCTITKAGARFIKPRLEVEKRPYAREFVHTCGPTENFSMCRSICSTKMNCARGRGPRSVSHFSLHTWSTRGYGLTATILCSRDRARSESSLFGWTYGKIRHDSSRWERNTWLP